MRKRLLLVLLASLFGFGLLGVDQYTRELTPVENEQQFSEPDYYGEGLAHKRYNEQGQLQQTLSAKASQHYPGSASSQLLDPNINAWDDQGQQWRITAIKGEIRDRNEEVEFFQQVLVEPVNPAPGLLETRIETERLLYSAPARQLVSDTLVILSGPNTTTRATGMRLDMRRQQVELLSEVTTHYDQP